MSKDKGKNEIILGIDLGTTNSAGCIYKNGKCLMVPSAEENLDFGKSFPSYVAFTEDGEELVGIAAKRHSLNHAEDAIFGIKRKMGSDYKKTIHGKEYTPEVISSKILQKIKLDAEEFLGEEINKAVITVPANFNINQRTATKDAAEMAGIDVVRLISEPTAASLAYGIDNELEDDITILVFDLGGGTLDVTILEYYIEEDKKIFEVLSTSGDNALGGTDMDREISNTIAKEIKDKHGIDVYDEKNREVKLKIASEDAKIELSDIEKTLIELPYIGMDSNDNLIDFERKLTRVELEGMVKEIVEGCSKTISDALEGAHLTPKDIDKLILVGGPTNMPIVQRYVEEFLGKEFEKGIDPMECVAKGASLLSDVTEIVLIDVTPHTLCIVEKSTIAVPMIKKNTPIPFEHTEPFKTVADDQKAATFKIVQGEEKLADDNVPLGSFDLKTSGNGENKFDVTFFIDEDNTLEVTAKNMLTGKSKSITIDYKSRMSAYEKYLQKQLNEEIRNARKSKK